MNDNIMANTDLATVATFWNATEANIARNRLSDAGISSCLQGEEASTVAWGMANATGGIRLQVQTRDLERSLACLGEDEADAEVAFEEAERRREAGLDREGEEIDADGRTSGGEEPTPTQRDEDADRALRAALVGLIIPPVQLYVTWLLLKVFLCNEPLRGKHRLRAWVAAVINLPALVCGGLYLRYVFGL